MLKFIFSFFILAFSSSVIAQNNMELEIYVNGELEKVPMGRKNIFITATGDTIEYSVDDILKEMMKNQSEKNDTLKVADKNSNEKTDTLNKKELVNLSAEEQIQKGINKEKELKEKEEALIYEKQIPGKKALQNKQKVKKDLENKMIEEQNIKELSEKVKADPTAEKTKIIEMEFQKWVDSLEQADRRNEELKLISGEVTYTRELYPTGNEEIPDNKEVLPVKEKIVVNDSLINVVEEVEEKPYIAVAVEEKVVVNDTVIHVVEEVEEKPYIAVAAEEKVVGNEIVIPVVEKTEEPVKIAEAVVEVEEKKSVEIQKSNYDFKKYFLPDPLVTADNIGLMDTLKFINNGSTGNSVFPSMEMGSSNSFSLCYDYTVCNYHGYDEETKARQTTRYKVCLSGTMNDKNKVAEVYIDTKAGRKKIYYSVATLDDKSLVLVKRK